MGIFLTGRDPAAATWPLRLNPTKLETVTAGYTVTGGTATAVLGDASDSTYLSEANPTEYFRATVAPATIPKNARLYYVAAAVRGRAGAGNVKYRDCLIGVGDHSNKGLRNDNWKYTGMHYTLATSAGQLTFFGKNTLLNSLGQPMNQTDLQKGLYVIFGLNTVYGIVPGGSLFSEAYIRVQYDMPPSAVITYPAAGASLNDTAAPQIMWDYTDDLQPQAKFKLTVTDTGSSIKVHDSGLLSSGATAYSLPNNLPNGNYRIDLLVYQAWPYPGGDFPASAVVSSTFTIAVAKLGIPRIKVADNSYNKEFVEVIAFPEVNLLDFETSTFDRGVLTWITDVSNCSIVAATTPVKDGVQSGKVTITATTAYISTRKKGIKVSPGDYFSGTIWVNPLTLAGRSAQLCVEWRDSTGAFLAESSGAVVGLTINTWNEVRINNVTNLLSTLVYASLRLKFTSTVNGDIMYLDDCALWGAAGSYRNNLVSTTSWEGGAQPWSAVGSFAPTLTNDTSKFLQGTHSLKMQLQASGIAGDGAASPALGSFQPTEKYTASAYVWIPSGGPDVSIKLGSIEGKSSAGVRNQWARIACEASGDGTTPSIVVSTTGPYTGSPAIWVDQILFEDLPVALPWFNGSSAGGSWDGGTDTSTSHQLDTQPAWSRGGFYEFTPNMLSDADSSLENDGFLWTANTTLSGCTVAKSSTQHIQGAGFSLMLNKSTSGTNDIEAILGTGYYLPATAGQIFRVHWGLYSEGTIRTFQFLLNWFDANFVSLGSQILSIGSVLNTWQTTEGTFSAAPANTVYMVPKLRMLAVATTTEKHYLDGLSLYDDALGYTGYWGGFNNPANTDIAPTLVVDYQNAGETTWHNLGTQQLDLGTEYVVFPDYSLRSGVSRVYRGSMQQTENGLDLNSDYSASTPSVSRTLQHVWLASDDDPASTSYQFVWDGEGRDEGYDPGGELVNIAGREFPFPQFGEQSKATVSVNLALETAADQAAMTTLAHKKATVLFRDQRKRTYRGIMGEVSFRDIPRTGMQRASFTLQVSGDQP